VTQPLQTALFPPAPRAVNDPAARLLDVSTIYLEPAVIEYPRGVEILERYPAAKRLEVESHWRIPGLFGNEGNVERWNEIKRTVLVLGVKKSVRIEPNGRSTDYLAPSTRRCSTTTPSEGRGSGSASCRKASDGCSTSEPAPCVTGSRR
jgi:hypothetical protein